jgi:ABC-2 type transport system ATP-binding protein
MPIIEVNKLSKHFRTFRRRSGLWGSFRDLLNRKYETVRAVDDISFSIEPGEIVGYIGANGAGKSTTIKMLTGILVPTGGSINVQGLVPYKQRYRHVKKIGVVFGQRTQLWWDIAVIEALRLLQKIYEIPQLEFENRLKKFEEVLGIADLLNIPVRMLSLGQRMRCDLAASLLHNPPVLFLDEPTIGLDIDVKSSVRDFIKEINREYNTTVILTTHDLSDIEHLCRRVIMIDSGKLIFDGELKALRDQAIARRRLIIDFVLPIERADLEKVLNGYPIELESDNPFRWEISFDRRQANAPEIIGQLLSRLEVKDLELEDPKIEDVVREIYRQERGAGV